VKAPAARALVLAACLAASAATVPRAICGRDADRLFEGDREAQDALARGVLATLEREVGADDFDTGSALFDGEWALVAYEMSILGLGQIALEHPELRDRYLPAIRRAADALVDPDTLSFGRAMWSEDPIESLETEHGHAYLGYANLALGMVRLLDPETPHAALHDRITDALARRLDASPHGIFETYPGEAYPPDVSMVAGSIGLHQSATGVDRSALLARFSERFRASWVDATGYLVQSGDPRSGARRGEPRGSGTAIAAYALSFADPALSRDLHAGLARHGHARFLGFAAIREYAPGSSGWGDVDSGPVLFGVSVSATGFAIASARSSGDRDLYRGLVRTAWLFGVPMRSAGATSFLTGGPLGDAILLAMTTAQPTERWHRGAR
jgi:hypothetical protein